MNVNPHREDSVSEIGTEDWVEDDPTESSASDTPYIYYATSTVDRFHWDGGVHDGVGMDWICHRRPAALMSYEAGIERFLEIRESEAHLAMVMLNEYFTKDETDQLGRFLQQARNPYFRVRDFRVFREDLPISPLPATAEELPFLREGTGKVRIWGNDLGVPEPDPPLCEIEVIGHFDPEKLVRSEQS